MVRRGDPRRSQTWRTFLRNHARELVSIDFFTVPSARFATLYVFLVLAHERLRIVHLRVTAAPSNAWVSHRRGVSLVYRAALPPPRPRLDLLVRVPVPSGPDGHRSPSNGATLALAKSVRRTPHRVHPSRPAQSRPSCSRSLTSSACCAPISTTTTGHGTTSHWGRTRRNTALSSARGRSWAFPNSADCIIATPGSPHERGQVFGRDSVPEYRASVIGGPVRSSRRPPASTREVPPATSTCPAPSASSSSTTTPRSAGS